MSYRKRVEIYYTGQVHGEVFAPDGRRVGLYMIDGGEWWKPFRHSPESIERTAKKVHQWCDKMIKVCEEQELV